MSATPVTSAPPTSPRTAAVVAGLGYAALFVLAVFANFAVVTRLVDSGDPAGTLARLAAEDSMVRAGVVAFGIVFVLDVAIAWGLYVVLRPAGRDRSLLAAWFRLTYTVFLGVAVVPLFLALRVSTGEEYAAMEPAGREALLSLALEGFDLTWLVGLAAFGLHLMIVGWTFVSARIGPRLLGVLLVVAGAAYVLDTVAHVALADYARYADLFLAVVAVPSVVGEIGLTIWLLARAGKERHPTGAVHRPEPVHA
jgi:hypothetical protein